MAGLSAGAGLQAHTKKGGGQRGVETVISVCRKVGATPAVQFRRPLVSPSEDIAEAYEAIEQSAENQRLPTMDIVAFAGELQVLNYCLAANAKDNCGFCRGLAPSGPNQAFSLPIAQGWFHRRARRCRDPQRSRHSNGADDFSGMQRWAWQAIIVANNERTGSPCFSGKVPGHGIPIGDPAFLADGKHLAITPGHRDHFANRSPFKPGE